MACDIVQPVRQTEVVDDVHVSSGRVTDNLKALLSTGLRRTTITAWIYWFVAIFTYHGFFTWIPSLLASQGFDISKSFLFSIVIYLAQIPRYYSAAFVSEWLERKWTIAIYLAGGAVGALGLALAHSSAEIDPPRVLGEGFFADAPAAEIFLQCRIRRMPISASVAAWRIRSLFSGCQQTMNEGVGVTSSQSRSGQATAERSQEVSARQRYEDENTFARLAVSEMQRDLQRVEDQARMAQQDAQASRQLAQHARSLAQQAQNQARQAHNMAQQAQTDSAQIRMNARQFQRA